MAKKQKLGDRKYYFGCQIVLPPSDQGEMQSFTFQGRFDQRKLRKMLRKALAPVRYKTEELDYIILTYGQRMRPMTANELAAIASDE